MRYFIVLDNENNIISLHSGNNFMSILSNIVEVSEEDFNLIQFGTYRYKYENGKIVNLGVIPKEDIALSVEEQKLIEIADNIDMLIELQADILGGAI